MYERTYEQNDALGLNDMRLENYETPNAIPEEDEKADDDGDAADSQTQQPKDSQSAVSSKPPSEAS